MRVSGRWVAEKDPHRQQVDHVIDEGRHVAEDEEEGEEHGGGHQRGPAQPDGKAALQVGPAPGRQPDHGQQGIGDEGPIGLPAVSEALEIAGAIVEVDAQSSAPASMPPEASVSQPPRAFSAAIWRAKIT